jgi:hypothetical protein
MAAYLAMTFDLGLPILIIVNTQRLDDDSGVPRAVREQYPDALPIQLDPAYRRQWNERFDDQGLRTNLSFDTLYDCLLPWDSILSVGVGMNHNAGPREPVEPEPEPEPAAPGPGLRLV